MLPTDISNVLKSLKFFRKISGQNPFYNSVCIAKAAEVWIKVYLHDETQSFQSRSSLADSEVRRQNCHAETFDISAGRRNSLQNFKKSTFLKKTSERKHLMHNVWSKEGDKNEASMRNIFTVQSQIGLKSHRIATAKFTLSGSALTYRSGQMDRVPLLNYFRIANSSLCNQVHVSFQQKHRSMRRWVLHGP